MAIIIDDLNISLVFPTIITVPFLIHNPGTFLFKFYIPYNGINVGDLRDES